MIIPATLKDRDFSADTMRAEDARAIKEVRRVFENMARGK